MNPKAKRIIKITVDVLLWAFLIFSLLMTILAFSAQSSTAGFPKLGNTALFTVQTPSMTGPDGFSQGELILGTVLTDDEKLTLQVGDVVTYYMDLYPNDGVDQKELNTHRIIEVCGSGSSVYYRTKGDNNQIEDKLPVYPADIQAIWTGSHFKGLGSAIDFLQSSTGFLVCVVIPLAVFFIYELVVMIMAILKIKNKDKVQITKEDEELIKQRAIEEYLARQAAEAQAAPAPAEDAPVEEPTAQDPPSEE